MVLKQIAVSDVSNDVLTDDIHVRVVVDHPHRTGLIELDLSLDECKKFQGSEIEQATFTIHAPNSRPLTVQVDTETLATLFQGVDFDVVLDGGRKTSTKKADKLASRGTKLDYTAIENIGLIHRGRVTDTEAAMVRDNRDQANQNREREGQTSIGTDPKDAARYGL